MDIFFIIVVVLFVLAISDLIVGVTNDAVNFLNSAVGSKVAPRHIILIVASLGVLIGAAFSSGLMEVARKGIFNPEMFQFQEIMIIFLAVMITDVLLLDLFNTFGLPTSTTVSIIFELLGASVAVAALKILNNSENISGITEYLNTSKALAIISGILISVVVSFTVGSIVQFFVRFVFTFDFEKRLKRYGAIWGGFAFAAITYFILAKGAAGIVFVPKETILWIQNNAGYIFLGVFLFWGIIFQMIVMFTKIHIVKPIVLFGTFSLALAFAANDLVNFIGVPLAGLSSYQEWIAQGKPSELMMNALTKKVSVDSYFLLAAGIIMGTTLWMSKKAQTVTKTEVNLGRQFDGFERFESSTIARIIVRMSIALSETVKKIIPQPLLEFISKRFETIKQPKQKDGKQPAYDLIRASVNLTVASILISFATSLKLPLSTTYVTFMVAMGTSLSDKAWGRESAVYRVSGVLTIITGWFFTAFMAFTFSAIFGTIIYFGGLAAILILIGVAIIFIIRTQLLHKRREKDEEEIETLTIKETDSEQEAIKIIAQNASSFIEKTRKALSSALDGLFEENRNKLKKTKKDAKNIRKAANALSSNIFKLMNYLQGSEISEGKRYGKIISSAHDISDKLDDLTKMAFEHVDNNHKKLLKEQIAEFKQIETILSAQFKESVKFIADKRLEIDEEYEKIVKQFKEAAKKSDKNQMTRMKKGVTGARNSVLFLNMLSYIENISEKTKDLIESWNAIYKRN